MASSKASNAGSSYQEQREQKVLDVIFLCDEWKSSKGGLSTFNREFAINLAQATTGSMKIHCYVSNSDDRDREDAEQHGVNLIKARSVPGSADPLECLKFPPSQLPKPHLVIGHGRKLGIPANFLAQSTKCKWVQFVHVYCEDLGKYKESATAAEDTIEENEKKHKMEIELCKAADAVVAVGSRLQQKYSRRLLNVEVKIITPGIFGKFSNESKLAVDRSVVKNFNVSLFGRAAFEDLSLKGYDVVANAIGSLGENFELTFVGSSPGEQRKVEQWFLDNTSINRNQLTIRRYCSEQEELKLMFYQSDLVALPSRTEGFGLVALQAISAGVPVLVSGESGIAEALQKVEGGNTVIVGSGEDKDEWARRIREMYEESAEEREANAVKLRENYRKVYSWKAECERFKGLIENVVKTTNGGELNVKVAVDGLKPEEQNMQTGMLATESARCQGVQQPRASATSAASGSVSYPQTEDFKASKERDFQLIFRDCYHSTKPQSIEEWNWFRDYLKEMKVLIIGATDGSLVITVRCESLMILEEFWTDYSSGHLGEVVQNCFVTEKILKELNLAELRLKTTIDIEEYNACKTFFEKDALRDALSSEFHSTSSTSESSLTKEQLEKSEQKTKIMETVKLEGASSSEFHSISSTSESPQKQEELKKWKQKTKIVETEKLKATSPLTVIPTTGHGKELIGKAQGRKGMLPLHRHSTSDPEEKLEELLMNLKKQVTCSICLDTYTEPKILSCHHTFCCECLERHAIVNQRQGKFRCPECQVEINLPEGNRFDCLPNSFLHKSLLSVLQAESREGTSPSNVPFTAGHQKKWEVRHNTGKFQEEEGSSPPPPLSITDLEEKLVKVCEDIKMLRVEGSSPPPVSTVEVELEELVKKLQKGRLEGALSSELHSTSSTNESPQKKEQWEKSEQKTKIMETMKLEGTSPLAVVPTTGHGKEQEESWGRKGSSSPPLLSTTDLEEKLQEVWVDIKMLRMEGSFPVLRFSTINLEKKLAELSMEFQRLREEGTLSSPELRTANFEQKLKQLRRELKGQRAKALENAMYPTIRSGLAKFDVSLPEELQCYVSYLSNELAKLGLRRRVLQSPRALEELREAMDQDELKTFLTIHIREGAWQVVLLFMDELPKNKLPWDWYYEVWGKDEEMFSIPLYSSTLGILKAWPTEYDPNLITLCKAITNRDWKVTRLILSTSRISDEGLKNLSKALTQSELYSLTLYDVGLKSQGLEHLCEALISSDCNLTSLNVGSNWLREVEIMNLCNMLTSDNCTLTDLNVSWNKLGDAEIMHLCDALTSVYCTLASLNVSWIQLGDVGIMNLCNALISVNCTLISLNVSWNQFAENGLKYLCHALTSSNCALTTLDICNNEFGDEGIKHLCKALTDTNCKLRSLDFHGNRNVTDEGQKYLSQMLTGTDWKVSRGHQLSRPATKWTK